MGKHLDKLKKKVLKKLKETSTTGSGPNAGSFTPGAGAQYATPFAFNPNKKAKGAKNIYYYKLGWKPVDAEKLHKAAKGIEHKDLWKKKLTETESTETYINSLNLKDPALSQFIKKRISDFDAIEDKLNSLLPLLKNAKKETMEYYKNSPDFKIQYGTDLAIDYLNDIIKLFDKEMRTLQEHYNAIKNGKGNKNQFLKQARTLFPQYINQFSDYNTAANVLKSKQIISEIGGVVGKGFDIWDWKKILAEEAKSVEKETSKEVLDAQANAYDNKNLKNADNINFNEIMKGFYCEMKDEKNKDKNGDEIKDIVIKNLAKDSLYYTKNGEFGVKGLGYTTEAPGLGEPKEPKGKHKSSGYGDLNTKTEKVKANVQDSLGDKEAKTSNPSKVKEMPVTPQNSTGVKKMPMPGSEKTMKLQENTDVLDHYLSVIDSNDMGEEEAYVWLEDQGVSKSQIDTIMNYAFPIKADKDTPSQGMTESEIKLRSLIQNIIKEELNENYERFSS